MRSIRSRLVFMLVGFGAVGVIITVAGVIFTTWFVLDSYMNMLLVAKVGTIAVLTERNGRDFALRFREDAATQGFEVGSTSDYFQVWRPDGTVLARSPSLGSMDLPKPSSVGPEIEFEDIRLADGRPARMCWARWDPFDPANNAEVKPGEKPKDGPMLLVVAASTFEQNRKVLLWVSGCVIVLSIAALALLWIVVRTTVDVGLSPLQRLRARLSAISPERIGEPLSDARMPAELVPVVGTVNGLLDRVRATIDRERRFAANAAHELRTPVAELRVLSEVALRGRQDVEPMRKALASCQEVSVELESMIVALLSLARQGAVASAEWGAVDVTAVVRVVGASRAEAAIARGVSWSMEQVHECRILTHEHAVRMIATNLIENAAEYTPEGGAVRVELTRESRAAVLAVSNWPVDLEEPDLAKLFDPFWRKAATKTSTAHAGLGLALVRSLVHGLGGEVTAELSGERHLRVITRIPDGKG